MPSMASPLFTQGDYAILEECASFACRPLDWAYWAFPWGEKGTELEDRTGLEPWQEEALLYLQDQLLAGVLNPTRVISEAVQIAVRSGHDIGKSAWLSLIMLWAISTRENTKGVVTANTEKQLRLKLWAELAKWHRLFIAKSFFRLTATSLTAMDPDREKEWRIDAIPWSEDNPEAFAGLHNYGKRVFVAFDEASAIVDKIWETIDGVMNELHTELIWIVTGNPTRNVGRFRECFEPDGQGQFWHTIRVDSREVSFTNKERIQKQIDLWGIDSDFIKVRWLGEFPSASTTQLIPTEFIAQAMRSRPQAQDWEPLVLGVDVARFGSNESVAQFRRGRDARSIPARRWRGLSTVQLGTEVAELINLHEPDAVMIDAGGVGGGVIDFVRSLGHTVFEVHFGSKASIPLGGELAANKRAEMFLSLRWWLGTGGCIPEDLDLKDQLISIEYGYKDNAKVGQAILLLSKEDMSESPDWGDALALTFAFPVSKRLARPRAQVRLDYDPLCYEAITHFGRAPEERKFPVGFKL